ncbi:hypothetical protein WJX77_001095 [Trebouxia sp. C0004]
MSTPHSEEAGFSGQADAPKVAGAEAAGSDDMVGIAQPDIQHQQQTWVKYTAQQEAQVLPEWRQQDSLLAHATAGFGKPHLGHIMQHIDPAQPLSASLRIVQAPATYNRPIVQRKLFKPAFVVRLEMRYRGQVDLTISMMAHVLNDNQYSKPGAWQPHVGPGQADLEGHLITRRMRVPPVFTSAQPESAYLDPAIQKVYTEDFKFTELNFVKSSRMSKRWLLFSCFIKEELMFVLYKLPTVVISRRTDQYIKAFETLLGREPQSGVPKSRSSAIPKTTSGNATASQAPPALQTLHQYRKTTEAPTDLTLADADEPQRKKKTSPCDAAAGAGPRQEAGSAEDRQIQHWILQQYASMALQRPLSQESLVALERRARAGSSGPPLEPALWEDFKDWFSKCVRALKQVEEEWKGGEPPCICGFAVDRPAADAALRYHPVGAFLVRMCSEPGSFAISCRTFNDAHHITGGLPEGIAGVEHLLVDCVDLQRRELWQYVAAWGAATHLLDPFTQRLHPKNQVFFRPSAAVHQAHLQVAAHTPPPDADHLLMQGAKHPADPQQSAPTPLLRPGATSCPPDPTSLILAGIPCSSPRLAHPPEQPFEANQEVVQRNNSWSGPAGEVYGNSHGAAAGLNLKMGELLAAMQKHLAAQGSHAGHPQLPLAGMPFTPSVGQKAVHHQQQQQQQQQQDQQQQQQQQQQHQQQWVSDGTMATEQQQGQQRQQQRHWQESGPQAMWPDPTTASLLQHLLQQSRAPRSWLRPEESDGGHHPGYSHDVRASHSQ